MGLVMGGCSGSNGVDLGSGGPGGLKGGAGTDATTDAAAATVDGAVGAGDDATGDPSNDAGSTLEDAGADAPPDDGSPGDADGADAEPQDGAIDEAGTFACGPAKRCLEATQYCSITSAIVVTPLIGSPLPPIVFDGGILKLDAGSGTPKYTCVALPACDSSDECSCINAAKTCTCTDTGDAVTRDCTGALIGPVLP